ncbi:unnamed protein product [Oreochromis niloticus]|nr:unnamed protein product [Mustela putorius furo]
MEKKWEEIYAFISAGSYPSGYDKAQRQNLRRYASKFQQKDGELFVGTRKVVKTMDDARKIFHEFHSSPIGGHTGTHKTLNAVCSRFYWFGMTVDIKTWILECDQCQKVGKPLTAVQPLQCIQVSEVWELIGIDLTGPLPKTSSGFQYILTATDYFSKWVEAFPLKTKSASEVAQHLCSIIYRHGCPKRILSDQGREFVNELNSDLCKLLQIERSVTAAYHPQTNGLDEKTNDNIKRALRKLVNDQQNNWDLYLDPTLFSLRSKVHTTTKYSPFFLMYGREAVFPSEVPAQVPFAEHYLMSGEVTRVLSTPEAIGLQRTEIACELLEHQSNADDYCVVCSMLEADPETSMTEMVLEDNIITFVKNELKKIQKLLNSDYPEQLESLKGGEETSSREAFVNITLDFLRKMKHDELADLLKTKTFIRDSHWCQGELKSTLKKKFQCVFEGIAKAGNPTLLNQIYTELYITEGGTAEVNDEHEVRQMETASRKPDRPETTIRQEDIFKASPGRDVPIRTVLTKGVAGIGKTVLTQKYTLDWAEDKANQDIQFMFPFTFRELNVLKEEKFSLVELVHHFFTETKEAGICSFEDFQVVFIFDGLDECRLPLDFHKTTILTDPRKSTSVDVLLINLIRGKLLPSAYVWITTRPAAANQIPPDCVGMVTEIRGFTDPQKEEYFWTRFRDKKQASRIISHIKTSRTLHIMCHIPVFCWIAATVLEDVLKTREGGQLPKTLTDMYIHFLVVQAKVKKVKYDGGAETDPHWSPESRKMIESLGKLSFDQLQKGNLIFYESDLTKCGIDIRAASVYSGVFTQIFKEERGLYQDKVFCFIHLSVQEFLAALHVHLTFINSGLNLLEEQTTSQTRETRESAEKYFYQSAVNKSLQSPNGHLDLFLRFLMGLSLQTNQTLLRGLLTQTGSSSQTNQETVQYIKKTLSESLSSEKSINLFHCLNELNDRSLVEEIQQSLRSGSLSTDKLSPAQWSALVFILLSSENDLDVFDLSKYSASEEALLRLLPVVKASNKAL